MSPRIDLEGTSRFRDSKFRTWSRSYSFWRYIGLWPWMVWTSFLGVRPRTAYCLPIASMGGGDSDFSGIESSRDERPLPPLPSPEMNSPLEANTERPLGDTRDRRNGEGSSSQQNDIVEQALLRSPSNFASASDAGPSIGTSTAVEGEPVQPTSLKSTGGPESNSQLEEINSLAEMPAYQTQERFASQLVTSSRDVANVYSSTHGYSSGSDSLREPLALSHTYSEGRRREQYVGRGHSIEQSQIIIPRWQPDAEVTLCPICRTQFSKSYKSLIDHYECVCSVTDHIIGFFIRKHHCRSVFSAYCRKRY